MIITLLNTLFDLICLIITINFYSKKLMEIKGQNEKEYKSIKIYVRVFSSFAIVLIITRVYKWILRILIENLSLDKTLENIMEYIDAILFASDGIINSVACLFFFKSTFACCKSNYEIVNIEPDFPGLDLYDLGNVE